MGERSEPNLEQGVWGIYPPPIYKHLAMFRAFQRRIPFAINHITTNSFQSPSDNKYFSTVHTKELFEKSCYHNLDFKINHTSPVQEAVVRFSAF
jgi:hypothetical protein